MLPKCYRGWTLLLLAALFCAQLPTTPISAAPRSAPAVAEEPPQSEPIIRTVPLVTDPHRPSLTLHLDVAPSLIAVGDTAAITLTVMNGAPDPADNVVITLPTPDGALALPGPNTIDPLQGWRWDVGHLVGYGSTTMNVELRMLRMPKGEALLLHPELTARDMALPIREIGGALVVDRTRGPLTISFTPGSAAALRSSDGHVRVQFPSRAAARRLTLRHARMPSISNTPPLAGFRRGFGAFALDATDDQGSVVHQFSQPLTITIDYTPEQLQALGIAEGDLRIFWLDEAKQRWTPLPTDVDPAARTASTVVDHFSNYQLSDGASPSDAYIPSLQGWQVAPFTGAATYSYPIAVPAGPGGLKPQLALTYNSGQTDGMGGTRSRQQAGWVGKGWSLDTGAIMRRKITPDDADDNKNYFTLSLNGQSFDLTAEHISGNHSTDPDITHWKWQPTDESFMRVDVVGNGVSSDTHGGHNLLTNTYETRHKWRIWTKDGTLYEFAEDLWWGWKFCDTSPSATGGFARSEAYKWLLSKVTDPYSNTITYTYGHDIWPKSTQPSLKCFESNGTPDFNYHLVIDRDAWPTSITWGHNNVTGASDRYKVEFVSTTRPDGYDTAWDDSDTYQYGDAANSSFREGQPRETRMLQAIRVWSMPASTWQVVREYQLDHVDYSDTAHLVYADNSPTNYNKLTLKSITPIGRYEPGQTSLPALPTTTFTYQTDPGTQALIKGGWNRLQSADNGYGGVITFNYEHIAQVYFDLNPGCASNCIYTLFRNFHRVKSKTLSDGRGNTYTWNYTYGQAAVNSLGSNIKLNNGPNTYPTSAIVYYANFTSTSKQLARPWLQEFRGHAYTIETDPTGAQTKHWFYQGEASDKCTPNDLNDPCFPRLRDGEFLKGREYLTQVFAPGGTTLLRETQQSYGVTWYSYGQNQANGLWRGWSYPTQTDQRIYEGGTTPIGSTTRFCYDPSNQGGAQYGNLTHTRVYDRLVASTDNVVADCDQLGTGTTPKRITRHDYIAQTTAGYIVDRVAQEAVWDEQRKLRTLTESFYDGTTTYKGIGAKGALTLVRAYLDVGAQATDDHLTGRDISYGYDSYGNRTTETTYTRAGKRDVNGGALSYSAPGNASAARTTTTTYDSIFHAFSIQVTNALGQSERAAYDYRMGTLTRVTGPNTSGTPTDCNQVAATEESTCAFYDVFGRPTIVIKPGDSTLLPTIGMNYYDLSRPFRYVVDRRVTSGSTPVRQEQKFYDGLGRLIQTKLESGNGTQNIVVDTVYDGRGQVIKASQPRYVSETSASFVQYTPLASDTVERWTQTTYDALARPRLITAPDIKTTEHFYGITGNLTYDDVVDPNRHRTQSRYDTLGRLVNVEEIAGTCSVNYWPQYACPTSTDPNKWQVVAETTYGYDARDQLQTVTDDVGNVTSLTYDSLGRKLTMVDPDMGAWYYGYDANGQLVSQRDARGWPTTFTYDALGRLTSKFTNDASVTTFSDAFDTKNTSNWTWSAQQTVPYNDGGANVVKSTGTGSNWNANFYRTPYTISSGEGVLVRFKVDSTTPNAVFALETGSGASYRRYGVVAGSDKIYIQYTLDGTTYLSPPAPDLIADLQINTWYVLQLVVDNVGGFSAQVYQENNPSIRGAYTFAMPTGQTWRFHHWIYSNNAYIDSYNERSAAVYGYDAGTNGKGRRTSMRNPAAQTSWTYDARGRKISALHQLGGISRTFQWAYDTADRLTNLTYPAAGGVTEKLTYGYDEAWRPQYVCTDRPSTPCYVISSAQYSALDQPIQWKFGNNLYQTWSYSSPLQRLSRVQVGTASAFGSLFDRSYTYDNIGDVDTIADNRAGQTQNFDYDHRDRLTHAWTTGSATNAYNENYGYDTIGNLTSKAGASYTYGTQSASCAYGALSNPHSVVTVGGTGYCYDLNGNMTSGAGRSYAWNADNLPISINATAASESYSYDADGERVAMTRGGVTTVYLEGLWEESLSGGAVKQYYSFNGRTVAVRDSSTNAVTYLHNDHLGSINLATTSGGTVASQQDFDPWGKVRGSGSISQAQITQTGMNYTGQRLDATGLLYYHARYYDPGLGRFVSPDTLVPGGDALSISGSTKQGVAQDPQDLNRYAYVNNNPLNHTDPTGHCGTTGFWNTAVSVMSGECTSRAVDMFRKSLTTEQMVVSGAVAGASAVGAAAGWVGGALLAGSGLAAASAAVEAATLPLGAQVGGIIAAATAGAANAEAMGAYAADLGKAHAISPRVLTLAFHEGEAGLSTPEEVAAAARTQLTSDHIGVCLYSCHSAPMAQAVAPILKMPVGGYTGFAPVNPDTSFERVNWGVVHRIVYNAAGSIMYIRQVARAFEDRE